ncbi:sigma-70 family RNA polymerase sigma factor [Porticoccus sp. W117]|uniref:RNA polymerase sigma factor n=1 Tax=Porticoccus sp. W117 TaxID=3054777 RepID=UPI0025988CBC|nr:sigma-70 family RNA polymerase sigma factor [Porticoccus sp. W117]MDM3872159.1 sigma-70 family RNA polymerase sigma factor [Porticoccus sp. W117]
MQDKRRLIDGQTDMSKAVEPLEQYARDYGNALKRYFQRRGASPEQAEDLAQDVFTRLAASSRKGEIDNPEAYLMRTASNVWVDVLRKKESRGDKFHVEYEDSVHSPEVFSPENVLGSRDELNCLLRALDELAVETRQIYLLCRVDGMKRKDVGKRMGISESAVDRHLMKAAKKISQVFGERNE